MKSYRKGKSYEEIYGKERAIIEKNKRKLVRLGKKHSEETRKIMSEKVRNAYDRGVKLGFQKGHKLGVGNNYAKGHSPWSKGETKETDKRIKNVSENCERKKKISIAMTGRKLSLATKRKMSKSRKGMKLSQEWRKNIGHSRTYPEGSSHPNWNGGTSFEPYSLEWTKKFKKQIRKRDNQICMLCGIHREKLNLALDIHHINYDKKLTIPENCISLCHSCHMKTNFNRKHWIDMFQSILNKRYNYQYINNCPKINL